MEASAAARVGRARRLQAAAAAPGRRERLQRRLSPEVAAGGFSRNDQMVVFFTRVRALLRPDSVVLDYGAGRGKWADGPADYKRELMTLQGEQRRVVGFDIDPAVRHNPMVDEAVVGAIGDALPFPDEEFDLISSRATFEHVADAQLYARELGRVLKPGGWLCAWTPNKWGLIGLGARIVPNALHAAVLAHLQPDRREEDIFPTVYRMNSLATLRRLFPEESFVHASYCFSGPPGYHANRILLARLWQTYETLMPPPLKQMLHIFIRKRPRAPAAAGATHAP